MTSLKYQNTFSPSFTADFEQSTGTRGRNTWDKSRNTQNPSQQERHDSWVWDFIRNIKDKMLEATYGWDSYTPASRSSTVGGSFERDGTHSGFDELNARDRSILSSKGKPAFVISPSPLGCMLPTKLLIDEEISSATISKTIFVQREWRVIGQKSMRWAVHLLLSRPSDKNPSILREATISLSTSSPGIYTGRREEIARYSYNPKLEEARKRIQELRADISLWSSPAKNDVLRSEMVSLQLLTWAQKRTREILDRRFDRFQDQLDAIEPTTILRQGQRLSSRWDGVNGPFRIVGISEEVRFIANPI